MVEDDTTPTGWDQTEDPAFDSPVLGAIAIVMAIASVLCSWTYVFSLLAYLGAAVALPLGMLARGVPRSRELGTVAVVLAVVACVAATAVLLTTGG